ncbi:MAG: sensor domain-containing protein [Omnitrophica WOR_2 bacterium]
MSQITHFLKQFFGVFLRGQTYLNIIYLLLAFPLGIFYFVFLVTGFALGFTLLIVLVGLLLLAVVVAGWWGLAVFERQLTIWLLHEDIPQLETFKHPQESFGKRLMDHFTNPVTWTSLVYLFVKFPLGILSFAAVIALVAASLALITAPLTFWWVPLRIDLFNSQVWMLDSLPKALIALVVGLFLALISFHILNALAWVSGRFARYMLGGRKFSGEAAAPAPYTAEEPAPSMQPLPAAETLPVETVEPAHVDSQYTPASTETPLEASTEQASEESAPEEVSQTAEFLPPQIPAVENPNTAQTGENSPPEPPDSL